MTRLRPVSRAIAALAGCAALAGPGAWPAALAQGAGSGPAVADAPADQRLSVLSFARLVVRSDELVRAQALEQAIAGQSVRGAQAIYEPFLTTSLTREGKLLPTTAEESFSRGGGASQTGQALPYESYVNQLKLGMGLKSSSGADWELSYNMDTIINSLQAKAGTTSPEYRGSLGFAVTQPLMRNFGTEVTEAGIRIAEREEAIARETVRQVTAQRLSEGLQTYLFVQRAQDRVRWRQQALRAASQLEREMARQQQAGLKSLNELTEARANLALRQAQLAQAQQELEEQVNALQVFLSAQPLPAGAAAGTPSASRWLPADELQLPPPQYADSLAMTDAQTAFAQRPETRVNRLRIEREDLRRALAKNQAEPELTLRVRYGKESLMDQPQPIHEYLDRRGPRYNNWGVGLTYRVGLLGDAKKDSEYQAAVLRKSQAELSLGAAQQRITNELLGVKAVLERALQQARRQGDIVKAQNDLLAAERRMMAEGQKSLLDVLRREVEVAVAHEALSDATAQVNRSSYIASQANGGLLSRFGLE